MDRSNLSVTTLNISVVRMVVKFTQYLTSYSFMLSAKTSTILNF